MDLSRLNTILRAGFFFHEKSSILLISNSEFFFLYFSLGIMKDMNDILGKSDVESTGRIKHS